MSGATAKFSSSYHLAAALRREPDPAAALRLFLSPTPTAAAGPSSSPAPPFRYSLRCYDIIVCKLAAARLFPAMESVLARLPSSLRPREPLLCRVISAYGRARLPAAARRAFAHPAFPAPRTARALNTLLHALLACRAPLPELLSECRGSGIHPDACTYNILMRAAVADSGSVDNACLLFDEMLQRGIAPTVVTFGTLVTAFCEAGRLEEAFKVKEVMSLQYNIRPNAHVYASLMKALCEKGKVDDAHRLKEEMVSNSEPLVDSGAYATLARALFRLGKKGDVVSLLEEMKEKGIKVGREVHNSMIAGFCEDEGDLDAAFVALGDMQKGGCKPDSVSYNTLVGGLCKMGRWRDASELVEDMPRRGCRPDVVTYRRLFDGICDAGGFSEARRVFNEMVFKGFAPSKDGVRKFVGWIEREGDAASLESVLCQLASVNALESSEWEKAMSGVLHDPAEQKIVKLLDNLRLA
uniref:Pentacotripeptide-repeat region of PRORP domain-containing protein n=1 Tax=Oryza glumipatula TaxID=40148 RepID=A0A0D9ZVK8_9ORYZ